MDESKRARRSAAAWAAPAAARSRLLAKCAFLAVLALILLSGPHSTAGTCAEPSECEVPRLQGTAGIWPALPRSVGILPALSFSTSAAPAPEAPAAPAPSPESPQAAQQPQPPPPQQPPAASSQPPSQSPQQPTAPPRKKITAPPAQSAPPPSGEGAANFRDDNPGERERWFYEQRAFPLGFIPFGIRQRAVAAREAMRDRERRLGIGSFAPSAQVAAPEVPPQTHIPLSTTSWTPIGPQPTSSTFFKSVSGRVSALAVDPNDPNIIYVGGAQGGLWKSIDGGTTWAAMSDFEASLAVGAIAIDGTTNPSTIYVGTGEQTNAIGSYYGAGILKSVDGGLTWTQLGQATFLGPGGGPFSGGFSPGAGARISSLAIRPGTGGATAELLAGVLIFQTTNGGASSGVYRSTDAGMTWTQVLPGAVGTEVLFDPRIDPMSGMANTAYAALGTIANDPDNGIYKSTNGGMTWSKQTLPSPATTTNLGRIEIAIAPSSPDVLYASVANGTLSVTSDDLLAVFKTINGGTTWTEPNTTDTRLKGTASTCSAQCWYDHVIRVHPNNPDVVYLGGAATGINVGVGDYLIRSTNGGGTWTGIAFDNNPAPPNNDLLHVDIQSMAFAVSAGNATRLFVGTDGGVWSASITGGGTGVIDWDNHNGPTAGASTALSLSQFYPGHSIHPSDTDIAIGGTQDNGTQRFSGTLAWQDAGVCGDGGFTAIDPSVPTTVYAACQTIDINKSVNGAATFASANGVIPTGERSAFIPPLVIDINENVAPFARRQLYFGTFRIWRGDSNPNSGSAPDWTPISPDLTAGTGTIRAIAISPRDSRIVWAGTSDGRVQRTLDASGSSLALWQDVTTSDLPCRLVTSIAIDPFDANSDTAYVTFSGFSGFSCIAGGPVETKGHVFVTTTGGATWTDISAGLPNMPVNEIIVDPDVNGTLYAGSDVGAWVKLGAAPWTTLDPSPSDSLPNVAVLGLKLHRASRVLRASTHGRGMWDLDVSAIAAPNYLLSSMNPSGVVAGSPAFTLTVTGIGFTANSEIRWNGQARSTVFVSSTELSAQITATDVGSPGFAQIVVFDPDPAKQTSNSLTFTIRDPPPPNDDFANATVIGALPFSDTVSNSGATTEPTDPTPSCGSGSRANTIWYRFTPAVDTRLSAETFFSFYDTVLSVYTGGPPGTFSSVICNDDAPNSLQSRVDFNAIAGTPYHFLVSDFGAGGGRTSFNLHVAADFSLSASPAAVNVMRGQTGTSTVTITPMNGPFHDRITFSCTGLPAQSACAFSPASLTPGGNPAMTQLTITTTAPAMIPGAPQSYRWTLPPIYIFALTLLALLLFAAGVTLKRTRVPAWLLGGGAGQSRMSSACRAVRFLDSGGVHRTPKTGEARRYIAPRNRAIAIACHVAAVLILVGLAVACGGGGGGGSTPPPPNQGTPTGTFSVTVRGTAGAVQRTTVVTLTVQ